MSKRPADAYERMTSKVLDEYSQTCWLTGFEDHYRVGAVADCHIYDAVLCKHDEKLTEALYTASNRIKLCASVHALWDARVIVINPDGSITTSLSEKQLRSIGLSRGSRLPESVLTAERRKYLAARINDRNAFHLAAEMAKHRRRVEEQVLAVEPASSD